MTEAASFHPVGSNAEPYRMTLFSIPKSFDGHAAVIQENALASWSALDGVEVVLFGDEGGVAEAAVRHSAVHVPEIERTQLGTPLVSSAFESIESIAKAAVLCYVNSDIILFDDLLHSVTRIPFPEYVLLGRRHDLDVSKPLDLQNAGVRGELRRVATAQAKLRSEWHLDYFVYPRGIDWRFPPLVVGRAGWDAWFVWRARELGLPVVDVSAAVFALHQAHDYAHVPGRSGPMWHGPETDHNMALLGDKETFGSIMEATHKLKDGRITRTWDRYIRSRVLRLEYERSYLRGPLKALRALYRGGKMSLGLRTKDLDESP